MSNLSDAIQQFLQKLAGENHLPPYLHNKNPSGFDPSVDSVYYSGPFWDGEELTAIITSVLEGQWLSSGERVFEFEKAFSKKFHAGHSVMVNSGSSANLVMVQALKKFFQWEDQDEIILSPVGFPTTIAPVVQSGLRPVFLDISPITLDLDPARIEAAITRRTRGMILSPVLGNSPDMERLQEIANRCNIALILDNCDSLGSRWHDRYLNEYALISSCSFYPAHHITTGEGGMVSSTNKELIQMVRSFAWWGRDCTCVGKANLSSKGSCGHRFDHWLPMHDGVIDHKYVFKNMGYNLKPLDLQGAVGLAQLRKFEEIHQKRRRHKEIIQSFFEKHVPGCRFLNERKEACTSWFGVAVLCPDAQTRLRLSGHLEGNRIQTRSYFAGNILLHPGYSHLGCAADFPYANDVLNTMIFIGCSPSYNDDVLAYIEKIVKEFV